MLLRSNSNITSFMSRPPNALHSLPHEHRPGTPASALQTPGFLGRFGASRTCGLAGCSSPPPPTPSADSGSSSPPISETPTPALRTSPPRDASPPGASNGAWCSTRSSPWWSSAYVEQLSGALAQPRASSSTWRRCACCLTGSSSARCSPSTPRASVRGPKHVVKTGKTPVLSAAETRALLDGIDALDALRACATAPSSACSSTASRVSRPRSP